MTSAGRRQNLSLRMKDNYNALALAAIAVIVMHIR